MIQSATPQTIQAAADLLSEGHLVGVPTETVYGLAANALDPTAVSRIFQAKGRPSNNPLIVHVADDLGLQQVVRWPVGMEIQCQYDAIVDLWPGPLTIVLPRAEVVPDIVTAGRGTVAVRMPSHPIMQQLLRACSFPLAAPSANRSKYVSPTRAEHVGSDLVFEPAVVLDGGECSCGIESTIVALAETGPRILRPGSITAEELAGRWGVSPESLRIASATEELEAPGMMRQHYSPSTPLCFVSAEDPDFDGLVGRIAFGPLDPSAKKYDVVEVLTETGNLAEVARKLFAAIRKLDAMNLSLIVVDECPTDGIGQAIMDRLRRATAQ